MDAWTPPVIVTPDPADAEDVSGEHWQLTRGRSSSAPLSLVRPDGVTLTVDFTAGKTRHRTTESGHGAQALSKAMGIRPFIKTNGHYPGIIDATGGLGQDAWALASVGCTVLVIERHPTIHALLADGLSRALDDEQCAVIARRITLIQGEATRKLKTLASEETHAIYLDPMYPDRGRKASSKKGMQFLHALLGPPSDNEPALLLSALQSGAARVAVKRPKGAPLLAGTEQFAGQRTSIDSPNTRYDIYHCR